MEVLRNMYIDSFANDRNAAAVLAVLQRMAQVDHPSATCLWKKNTTGQSTKMKEE